MLPTDACRTALITGAAGVAGLAIAKALAEDGYTVLMADICPHRTPLSVMKAEIRTGRVLASAGATVAANRNSFHDSRAVRIAAVITGETPPAMICRMSDSISS